MPVQFNVKITEQIIAQCKDVGVIEGVDIIGNKCPVAVALKSLFPNVHVSNLFIFPDGINMEQKIPLPQKAQSFIDIFDLLSIKPGERLKMKEVEFEISIPDEIINLIDIEDIKKPQLKAADASYLNVCNKMFLFYDAKQINERSINRRLASPISII